jgi:hypothetical protein
VEGRDGHLVENVPHRQSPLPHFGVARISHFECVHRFFFEVHLLTLEFVGSF